ncbi:MAG TPA: hypothetical protein VHB73_08275, partial [Alphaproteobacteria bacterium]|nr:hypothetical protein [Alphaproteobacteria bacterium]
MAQAGNRAQPRQPYPEEYAQYAEEEVAPPDPAYDNALRLANLARRFKRTESNVEDFSHALASTRRVLKQQMWGIIGLSFVCLFTTGFMVFTLLGRPHVTAPAVEASAAPASVAALPPPPVQASAARATIAAPAQDVAPAPSPSPPVNLAAVPAEEPAPAPSPRSVAMGRYKDMEREIEAMTPPRAQPAPAPRRISQFESAVSDRLAASNQDVPDSWTPIFNREANGDTRAKLQIAAKFLKGEGVK